MDIAVACPQRHFVAHLCTKKNEPRKYVMCTYISIQEQILMVSEHAVSLTCSALYHNTFPTEML